MIEPVLIAAVRRRVTAGRIQSSMLTTTPEGFASAALRAAAR